MKDVIVARDEPAFNQVEGISYPNPDSHNRA